MLTAADLSREIHPRDTMMTSTVDAYFKNTLSALDAINRSLSTISKKDVSSILDFGCGYGRVMRGLRAQWPEAEIVAADLMQEAVDFCAFAFGAIPVRSDEDLDKVPIHHTFDLIWVGSVFTHLPAPAWDRMFSFLTSLLNPDGVLVFTTHGRAAQWVFEKHTLKRSHVKEEDFFRMKDEFNQNGFAFMTYTSGMIKHISEKQGAGVSDGSYGLSFSRTDWVCQLINRFPHITLHAYMEGGWGKNHDVIAVSRPSDLRAV